MTDKTYFKKMAEIAMHEWQECSPDQLETQIIMVLKEVERDARYKACEMAQQFAHDVFNMRLDKD